jgi:undecaprenyl phosphate-alpha-L-ara4N flippase subunit ArnE
MNAGEFAMCIAAVFSSSIAQLLMKGATSKGRTPTGFRLLAIGVVLQLLSVVVAVLVLRTLALSQLVPFAAFAYVLVPLGSALVLKERLRQRFWWGSFLIVSGIMWTLPR